MEARLVCAALAAASFLSLGASHRTENFIVTAPTKEFARDVAEAAESFRRDLAIEWLGHELPMWQDKCPIRCQVGPQLGAGGATSFMFERGRPFGWSMSVQGSRQRILDSVLPHEVTHTIFATHFGRPLPRWADEGACTTVEHVSERRKQHHMLYEFLTTHRGIAFNRMFAMKEYPSDVLPLYAQGYSLSRFLIAQGGKPEFIEYIRDGMKWNNWTKATRVHYGYRSLSELQSTWLEWVRRGSPEVSAQPDLIAKQPAEAESDIVQVAAAESHTESEPEVVPVSFTNAPQPDSKPGWYARVRDRVVAAGDQQAEPPVSQAGPVSQAARLGNQRTGPAGRSTQSLSRQQPIGRPQQIILQWSRPHKQRGSASKSPPRTSRLVPNFGQSLWR